MAAKRTRRTGLPGTETGDQSNRPKHGDARCRTATAAAGQRVIVEGLPFPTDTEIAVLHERVLDNHAYAVEVVIERLLPVLTHLVRRSFPRTDEDLIVNAAEDALLEYSRRPQQFDRSRGVPLVAFLRMAAVRNAVNLVRAESRRRTKEIHLREGASVSLATSHTDATSDELEDPASVLDSALARAVESDEKGPVALWLKGERRTDALAAVLGIARLPAEQQRRTVKQLKDRIRKRLQRLLRR